MFKDDDDEEENTFGVTRYPCMPSLVALQQMRNRLHLAFLGRKLMKWTALATGREMRRLAQELYEVYQGFGEDMRNAFILLARGRYFCPMLNDIVTENIGKKAGVIVEPSYKAISGVKIVQFEIFETEVPPYAHLGLEKGGQAILEAKKAWLEILKRLIMMMQLRASFMMVELANKNATKKWNVLSKLVVPRLNLSCRYILSELEEIEREDNFRLKRFKELKVKKAKGKEEPPKAGGKPCECSPDLKAKESVRKARKPISESNICNVICKEDKEQTKVDSLEKSRDIKLKEVCSICKTDEEMKSNLEVNERDKDLCDICKNIKDNEKSEMDNKMATGICSKCIMHQNNKTAELNRAINSESICPACTDEIINKERSNDLPKKDSKLSKEIFDQGECPYCKKMDEREKSKIEICKECQETNAKSQVTNVINDKRTIDNGNLCPACTGRVVNEGKDIMSQITQGKEECFYCKRKADARDKSESEVCQGCQINNAKKEEMCPFCSNTKWNVISPTESILSTENKTKEQKKICPNCKKAKFDKNQINVNKGKCPYCQIDEPTKNTLRLETCQKCGNSKSAINNTDNTTLINKICPACTNQVMDEEEGNRLSKITSIKDECPPCRAKEVTNVQSKADMCKECQVMNAMSKNTKDSNSKCPECRDRLLNKLSKITLNKEECIYCKNKEQAIDKPKIEVCRECQVKNITDDKGGCPFCSKGIVFIDQRDIISPTESTLSVQNKSKDENKICKNCEKDERNKIETATSLGVCQLYDKDRAKSNFKMKELCSECKSKNIKSHNNKGIKKQERQSCRTCQSPAENDHKCDCSNSVRHKTSVKNISNACASCGKKLSKENFTTDTPSCSCQNENKSKQDILNTCTNNITSDARGTFKEIVTIKRFSGTDGITHEHITVTSKKTQKRVLSEPSCGKNSNNFIRETQSDNIGLNKPTSYICLSSCSSTKKISEKSSQNNSCEIASITSQSLSCTLKSVNALKKCEATCVPELAKKETNSCEACKKPSSRMSCRKDKSHDISNVKSCTNNNSYNKIKIIIKDDKCKDNSDDEEIELTPSTIIILKKILSRTSKSADSCKSFGKDENKMIESKCSCGTTQQSSLKCICKKANCDCNSKANTSLKIKLVKSEPCMKKTDSIDNKYSKDKRFCDKCDEKITNSKQNKNTSNKCHRDTPEMSKLSTPTGSCQECGKSKNKKLSVEKFNCDCNKATNCDCKKPAKKDERTCSCSKKQTVTIQKMCSCNNKSTKQASKCSSVESKYSRCCSESNETSSMANQTCLMDRLPVSKADNGTCVCNEKKSSKNKLKDNCQCSKQTQPQAKPGSCSCQSVNKSGDCSCKSSEKDKKCDCQTKRDVCSCSKPNQPRRQTSTCSCQSVNKNARCSSSNQSQECSCKSKKKKVNDGCQCSQLKPEPTTSTCSCRSVNKSKQARECSCKLVHDKSPCSCRRTNSKEQNTCGKQDINAETQQCSCSQSAKNLKSNVKFDSEPHKSLCPCKSSETGQTFKKSNSCSCRNEKESAKACPCQTSKLPSISPTKSNQSTTIASQTCCLPDDKPEKSIKFCDKASFTPNFAKSPTSISPKSSYTSLRSRSSQIKASQCSCGKKDVSTMTRRSDRYDVRTLRQLSFPPEPKNLSCLCKSDSALLQIYKPKNVKPLNRCQSLRNECCLRK